MAQEPSGPEHLPPPEPPRKRLAKSANEKILFGVAGGIAEYLDVDPILIRIGFIALLFLGGSALLIYIILAVVLPGANDEPGTNTGLRNVRESPSQIIGVVIVAVGVLLLLVNLNVLSAFPWEITWPAAIIAVGLVMILSRTRSAS